MQTLDKKFKNIERHIFLKAVNIMAKQENSRFRFNNLKNELKIKSIDQLQTKFLADFALNIKTSKEWAEVTNKEKLKITLKFLDKFLIEWKKYINPHIGTDFKAGKFANFFAAPKTVAIDPKKQYDSIAKNNKWYVLDGFAGTSEERALIEFIKETKTKLKEKYQEIYLLRNEEVYKIYDFKEGRGFAPDFLLFLKSKAKKEIGFRKQEIYYQVFIESKGDQFKDKSGLFKDSKEGWKEEFLEAITKKYGSKNIIKAENPNYRLIGLPLYNENNKKDFIESYNKELKLKKQGNL